MSTVIGTPSLEEVRGKISALEHEVRKRIVGMDDEIKLTLVCLFAGGHVLLEGVPGLAKTLFYKTLAEAANVKFRRISFAADLLPKDVIGIELVVALKSGGRNIKKDQALDHIYGYAVGLDMTRRDLQLHARDKGRPWEFGKSFSLSAPIGPIYPVSTIGHPSNASITLEVNGSIRQSSTIDQLIWSVADIIAYLSEYDVLEAGDLIMTGTPAGVGAVVAGDIMRGQIAGLGEIVVAVSK